MSSTEALLLVGVGIAVLANLLEIYGDYDHIIDYCLVAILGFWAVQVGIGEATGSLQFLSSAGFVMSVVAGLIYAPAMAIVESEQVNGESAALGLIVFLFLIVATVLVSYSGATLVQVYPTDSVGCVLGGLMVWGSLALAPALFRLTDESWLWPGSLLSPNSPSNEVSPYMSYKTKIARVIADDRVDTVRLEVQSPRGAFSLAYAVGRSGPMWNVANSPPDFQTSGYEVVDQGAAFVLLSSNADTVDDVLDELVDLTNRIGGSDTTIYNVETFRRAKTLRYHLEPVVERVKSAVSGVSP